MLREDKMDLKNIENITQMFVGTDDDDYPVGVMDFGVYELTENGDIGKQEYYIAATDTIISRIQFYGPLTTIELDFRDSGVGLLRQIAKKIDEVQAEKRNLIILSQIASILPESEYVMSLLNPVSCVRGCTAEGQPSPILQLIYNTADIQFHKVEYDIATLQAEANREASEMFRQDISDEDIEEAQAIIDEQEDEKAADEEMSEAFSPTFGMDMDKVRSTSEKFSGGKSGAKITGNADKAIKVSGSNRERVEGGEGDGRSVSQ